MPAAGGSPLGAAVVRVWGQDGRPVGGGFLAAPGHLLTAAHVVNLARGRAPADTRRTSEPVQVDFPLLAAGDRLAAEITHWVPQASDGTGDLAGLRLLDRPPDGAVPAPLVDGADLFDLRAVVLGFPAIADDGVWSIGRLRGRQGSGWVQIDIDATSQFDIQRGFSGTAVWDVGKAAAVGMVIAAWRGGRVRSAYMIPASDLFTAWPRLRELARPPSPFPGLRPFGEADADLFFGRAEKAAQIAELVRATPVVTVVGPPGVGKSSLIRAGVLPRLRRRPDDLIQVMRPSEARTPLRSLALALARADGQEGSAAERLETVTALAAGLADGGLREIVAAVLERRRAERLILVVDQLEEAFTGATEHADDFGGVLTEVTHPGARVSVLAGLRADFLGTVQERPRTAFLAEHQRLIGVGELEDAQLRDAIVRPIERIRSVAYQPGLVELLLKDVGYAPGRVTLVQFALAELWERQAGGLLTHEAYHAIGGVQRALAQHADNVWRGLSAADRGLAERLLVQLVQPIPGREAFTRRSAARSDFDDAVWALTGRLAGARIIVVREREPASPQSGDGGDEGDSDSGLAVELAHDSLLVQWERLGDLAGRHRDFRLWQEGLRQRIDQWRARNRPHSRLLSGADLRDAGRWERLHGADLSADERHYLAASRAWRRRSRRLVLTALAVPVLALAVVAAIIAGVILIRQNSVNTKSATTAADSLAATARSLSGNDDYDGTLVALRAYRTSRTQQAERQLAAAYNLSLQTIDRLLPDAERALRGVEAPQSARSQGPAPAQERAEELSSARNAISADGRLITTVTLDGKPAVWRTGKGRDVGPTALAKEPEFVASRTTIDAAGRHVAVIHSVLGPPIPDRPRTACTPPGSIDSTPIRLSATTCLTVFDVTTGRDVLDRPVAGLGQSPPVEALSIDPTGDTVAVVLQNGAARQIKRWRIRTGQDLGTRPLPLAMDHVASFWLAAGGGRAVILTAPPNSAGFRFMRFALTHLNLETPGLDPKVLAPLTPPGSTTVSGDGKRVAAAPAAAADADPAEYRVWDVASGAPVARLDLRNVPKDTPKNIGTAHLTLDRTGAHLYAARPTLDTKALRPTSMPTSIADVQALSNGVWESVIVHVWTWQVGGGRLASTPMRFPPGWFAFHPLGDGTDRPIALFGNGTIGLVLPAGDVAPAERLTRSPVPPAGPRGPADMERIERRVCATLTVKAESGDLRRRIPDGAYRGTLC